MKQPVLTPERFATLFNSIVPGAYRQVTAQDIRDMTKCGLVGRYGYYGSADIEVVRAVLQYEQLRLDREQKANAVRMCKRCGGLLIEGVGKGRPREYCFKCGPFRGRERWRKWYTTKSSINLNLNRH